MIHKEAGTATFTHECENRRHSAVISWGAGYPALDTNSMPSCVCGEDYKRVDACPPGKHDCHPVAGHVERSDDHAANLIGNPEDDPDEKELAELRLKKWQIEQKALIDNLEQLLAGADLTEAQTIAARITLLEAKRTLKTTQSGS